MPNNYDIAFTHSHELLDDGIVKFQCSGDKEKWPWLNLPPSHPIVIQSINYWASVETGKTRGSFDPTKWSALTWCEWEAGDPDTGPVAHGIADTPPGDIEENKPRFRLTFFDAADKFVCRMTGTGVIFKTRNFEAWRSEAKEKARIESDVSAFNYAPASALGVSSDVERFLTPLVRGEQISSDALITKNNGLKPNHPYHDGSGDHVNANHLVDAGFQFAHLIFGEPLRCTGGEISFRHYVELGKPFGLTQTDAGSESISVLVEQSGRA